MILWSETYFIERFHYTALFGLFVCSTRIEKNAILQQFCVCLHKVGGKWPLCIFNIFLHFVVTNNDDINECDQYKMS